MPPPLPPVKCRCYRMHSDDNRRQFMPGAQQRHDRGLLAANWQQTTRGLRQYLRGRLNARPLTGSSPMSLPIKIITRQDFPERPSAVAFTARSANDGIHQHKEDCGVYAVEPGPAVRPSDQNDQGRSRECNVRVTHGHLGCLKEVRRR